MKAAPAAAALLGLCAWLAGGLPADSLLRGDFEARVLAASASLTCAAQVWAPGLEQLPPQWRLADSFDVTAALPQAGAWTGLKVPVAVPGTTQTAQVGAKVRLMACIAAWSAKGALAPGAALGAGDLERQLFDPRSLPGPPWVGPLPQGATTVRALMPGQPLLKTDLNDPAEARSGQRVTLVVREGDIEAADEGVLLDSGGQGSLLRAQHIRSGKIVRGVLSGQILIVED